MYIPVCIDLNYKSVNFLIFVFYFLFLHNNRLCKKRPRVTGDDYLSTFQTETTLTKNTTTINRFTNETRRNFFSRQGPKSEPKSRRNNYRSLRYCTERN